MKTVLIFSLLIALTLANHRVDEIRDAVKACGAEFEGPNGIKKQVLNENADQVKLGSIIFCINKKIGIQSDDGDIDEHIFKKDLKNVVKDDNLVNIIFEECKERKGDTSEAVAFNFLKCYQKSLNDHSK